MSITNYSELQTSVANWLHRADLTDYIKDFIALGEARIYRQLRVREMETALDATISGGVIAVPAGYVELKQAYVNNATAQELKRKPLDWIYKNYPTRSASGGPKFIAREGSNFIFGPFPDDAYQIKGTYYKRLDSLSDSNTSNWLTTTNPDLILFAALCEAEPFIKNDKRIAIWEQKYAKAAADVQQASDREELSGSILSMTAG